MGPAVKLSVLLPTRNRADYLRYAARTVLEQDDPDLELVISDNASEDETAEVCRALDDPRVRYVRTDRPLPVSENWQNALEHASGDYVIMLGDDDALLRGYCRITRSIIERFERPELIYHGGYQFAYPGVLPDAPDGHLVGPHRYAIFGDSTGPVRLDARLAREQVQASLRFRMQIGYNMQYSTISRELIERLRPHGP
ncbi:MAG: glycosyltransferase family 2 protein, partial [Planctomycetota bacterium]